MACLVCMWRRREKRDTASESVSAEVAGRTPRRYDPCADMTLKALRPLVLVVSVVALGTAAPKAVQIATQDPAVNEVRGLLADTRYAEAEARARALLSARESQDPGSVDV